ncbi:MAG: hypothetical protein IK073_04915 [Paludibacteraceae bacterium]|nr:hypothetical protein [Paludibacteraceae bacterium]
MSKKSYLIPETETLSLESMGALMISGDAQNSPTTPGPFTAPQKVF